MYLFNGTCLEVCPGGTYAGVDNVSRLVCEMCASECRRCGGRADYCLQCYTGFYLLVTSSNTSNISTCVSVCPPTYFNTTTIITNISSPVCQPCQSPCLNCLN